MSLGNQYKVKKIFGERRIYELSVPGSKSITNRALLIAALSDGESRLTGALFSEDVWDMLGCLRTLGIEVKADEEKKEIIVKGNGGVLPVKEGEINVGNSGIAARFITALVCFSRGRFRVDAGEQMKTRPMRELIEALRALGARIECEEKEGKFPFFIDGTEVKGGSVALDTTVSSQFLSALLMSGHLLEEGLMIRHTGRENVLPYVDITVSVMKSFGATVEKGEGSLFVAGNQRLAGTEYAIEPDLSSASYFYAMAVILNSTVTVRGVHLDCIQGDIRFVKFLRRFGASLVDEEKGLTVIGNERNYPGIEVDMNACSDQTMTLAALALFARSHTIIKGVAHIRGQESDRLLAIYNEVIRLGARAEMGENGSITIFPIGSSDREVVVETYNDHRMAMAFSLVGLRRGGVIISNPDCVKKSFTNFFETLDSIIEQ